MSLPVAFPAIARATLRAVLLLALGYAALVAFVWLVQRRLQYFPAPGPVDLPGDAAAAGLREIELTAADGVRLKAWHWPGERALTLVVFHGNAGHRGDRLEWIRSLRSLGVGVLALDYRGYGGSDGAPDEQGLFLDGEAAARWVAERTQGPLVYVGESLGAGVAVETAVRLPPAALVLVGSFPSLVGVARCAYPWLPVGLLMRDRFECASKLARLEVPLMCVHAEADSIVPVAQGRAAFAAGREPKEWWSIPGADHNDVPYLDLAAFRERLASFLRRHGLYE